MQTARVSAPSPHVRAALYARVSTDMQTERFGLALQLHECRRYAEQHQYAIVKEYVEGEGLRGVSGAKTTRSQTSAILSDLHQYPGLFTILIVYDTSRLARDDNGIFGRWYEEQLRPLGVTIAYVQGGYGPDPEGQLLKRIKQDFDTYERQKIAIRDRAGMAARARQGLWTGGYTSLGYDAVEGRLVLNEEEAAVVREIFRLYVEGGLSMDEIGERLYQHRIAGKWERLHTRHHLRRPSTWQCSTIYRILTNPICIGQALWGRKKNPRPWLPQEQVEMACPRIISDALWQRAQAKLEANRIHGRRDKHYPYLVSGLVRCQICGRILCAVTAKAAQLSYYFCIHKSHRWLPHCGNTARYRVAEVDAAVWAVVVQGLSAPSALEAAVARHLETETVPAALEEARLKRLEEEITAIEQKVDEVLRLGAASALAQQRAEKLLQELDARHAVLGKERDELLQRLRAPGQATVSWQTTLSQYRRWLQGATWSDAGVGPLPTPATAEQGDLLALDPPARLYPLLLALRQKIVRDVVEKVVVDPAGAGAVYLRGNVIGVPITVSAIPAKMRNRRPLVQPVLFEVAEPSDSSSGEGD